MAWRAEALHVHLARDEDARGVIRALAASSAREVRFVDADDPRALVGRLPEIDVLVCGRPPRVDWSGATRLRLLHFLGAGVDGLFPAHGLARGVVIANARGIHAHAMRDHALAMMLAFARELPRALAQQAARAWEPFAGGTLAGCTLVVVGLGEVGRPIAVAAAALGMRVLGVRRDASVSAPGVERVFGPEALGDALALADYVVVATPLTARTRALIGPAELALLRPSAVIVQISRGGVVDEPALHDALSRGHLRGAALDVFAEEPLPTASPLWTAPNVIVTPHLAGWMPDYVARAFAVCLENVARLERGEAVRTPVDRAREY